MKTNRQFKISKKFVDIDECYLERDNCSSKAECRNTQGSFVCKCLSGYKGDGVVCMGKK